MIQAPSNHVFLLLVGFEITFSGVTSNLVFPETKMWPNNLHNFIFLYFLASLYLFEQKLRLGVIGTSSVCLPLQDESLYVFPNCKSLWIKASAKCKY